MGKPTATRVMRIPDHDEVPRGSLKQVLGPVFSLCHLGRRYHYGPVLPRTRTYRATARTTHTVVYRKKDIKEAPVPQLLLPLLRKRSWH